MRKSQPCGPGPRDHKAQAISECLAIINPEPSVLDLCRSEIEAAVEGIAEYDLRGSVTQGGTRALRKIARTIRATGVLMQSQPWLSALTLPTVSWGQLLLIQPGGENEGQRAEEEWIRVSKYLLAFADALEGTLSGKTRHEDFAKRLSAFYAFRLLVPFTGRVPTLTIDGAYYRLASFLYEAATGIPEANLERACRHIFREIKSTLGRAARSDASRQASGRDPSLADPHARRMPYDAPDCGRVAEATDEDSPTGAAAARKRKRYR
jgi:hypothetical protein